MDKGLLLHLINKKRDIDVRGVQLSAEAQQWAQDLKNVVGEHVFSKNGIDWSAVTEMLLRADLPTDDVNDRTVENERV
jgi:hypothetical protein